MDATHLLNRLLQALATLLAVSFLVYILIGPPPQRLYVAALCLILGGAVGNLIDRVAKGTVTDFIDPTHYPAFNIADSAIVCGVIAVAFLSLRDEAAR